MSSHWIGDTVEKEVTFRDIDGVLADPDVVNGNAKTPSGLSVAADDIINQATGIYDVLFEADEVGLWFYRIEGEGNDVNTVVEGTFCVHASSVE